MNVRALYDFENPESYRLINQAGVQCCALPLDHPYNACWDTYLHSSGRVYVAAASEITVGGFVSLYEYVASDNQFRVVMDGERFLGADARTIRPSKFHFSLDELPDGRLIACTHSTDRAPEHASWYFDAYYDHLWEGYRGSNIIIHDPRTGNTENLGIPVPRESIYGAKYNAKDGGYYMIGYARGHLYRYDLETRTTKDLGKVSEHKSFGLHVGPDDNVYGASRSGRLFRYVVDEQRLEFLDHILDGGAQTPVGSPIVRNNAMAAAINVPGTSSFIFSIFTGAKRLYRYDTETDSLTDLGSPLPTGEYVSGMSTRECIYAMDLDRQGRLWYAVTCYPYIFAEGNADFSFRPGASLMRWDLNGNGSPENLGMIGTPERTFATVTGLMLDEDHGRLTLVDSNHGTDGFAVLSIDLNEFSDLTEDERVVCRDPYLLPDTPRYVQQRDASARMNRLMEKNSPFARGITAVLPLWHHLPFEESRVHCVHWAGRAVKGLCGTREEALWEFRFDPDAGKPELRRWDRLTSEERDEWRQRPAPEFSVAAMPELPAWRGRSDASEPTAAVVLPNGGQIVGTSDGVVCRVTEQSCFSFGMVSTGGPIRSLASDPVSGAVWGVAGDRDDIGIVFRLDGHSGLRCVGSLRLDSKFDDRIGSSNSLSCIAVNDEGSLVAVGSDDQLGAVYVMTAQM